MKLSKPFGIIVRFRVPEIASSTAQDRSGVKEGSPRKNAGGLGVEEGSFHGATAIHFPRKTGINPLLGKRKMEGKERRAERD